MSRALADTSVFIARESGRPFDTSLLPDELAVSIITVAELRAGVLVADDADTRASRLATLEEALQLDPVPVDDSVASGWAQLRVSLRESGRRLKVNDSWIAATALALGVPLVAQDADYYHVPRLEVISL